MSSRRTDIKYYAGGERDLPLYYRMSIHIVATITTMIWTGFPFSFSCFINLLFLYFPGIYLTVSMALTSISVIGTVVILKIHYVGPYQSEVPGWLKRLCLGKRHCTCEKRVDTELTSRKTRFRSFKNQLNNGHPVDINDDINACSRLLEDYCKKNLPPVNTLPIRHIASQESLSDDDNASVAGKRGSATLEEILKCLQVLIRKRQTDDKILNITKEWRLVAIFVDKFLFYVFLFIMVLSSTVLLLIIPLSEYNFCDKKDDNQLP